MYFSMWHVLAWIAIVSFINVNADKFSFDSGKTDQIRKYSQDNSDLFLRTQIPHETLQALSNLHNVIDNANSFKGSLLRRKRHTETDISTESAPEFKIKTEENLAGILQRTLSAQYENSKIDVSVSVVSIQASSVTVNLKTTITGQENTINFIGVKITYRSFGSILKKDRLLLVRNNTDQEDKNENESHTTSYNDSYLISDLHSDTGYIFCFSLITKQIQGSSLTTTKPSAGHLSFPQSSPIPPIQEQHTTEHSLPHTTTQTHPKTEVPHSSRRNYAYTSTGKLIYLPASSWSPHSSRSKRSEETSLPNYCLEIQTMPKLNETITPIYVLIISMIFLGTLILIVITFLLWKSSCLKNKVCLCKCRNWQKDKSSNSQGKYCEGISKNGNNNDKQNVDHTRKTECVLNREYLKMQEKESNDGSHSIAKVSPICKRTYVKSDKLNEMKRLKMPPPLCLNPKLADSNAEFHPGYEVPPSSTVEAFGYDFPKQSSKGINIPPSTTPSSCDLNEYITDTAWDNVYARFNLDMPRTRHKRSEISKNINAMEMEHPFSSPCNKKYNTFHNINQTLPSVVVSQEDQENTYPDKQSHQPAYDSPKIMSHSPVDYDIETNNDAHIDRAKIITNVNHNHKKDDKSSQLQCAKSLGDVTVSGGTLIEVPEGYVIPKSRPRPVEPSIVRIVIS